MKNIIEILNEVTSVNWTDTIETKQAKIEEIRKIKYQAISEIKDVKTLSAEDK